MSGVMKAGFGGASLSISGMSPGGQMTRMYIYIIGGILIGLWCTAFAPSVARLLTFDAPADESATPVGRSDDAKGPPSVG